MVNDVVYVAKVRLKSRFIITVHPYLYIHVIIYIRMVVTMSTVW